MDDATMDLKAENERSPAQFFFEIGYGACWAEAYVKNGLPFPLTDDLIDRAWGIAGEAHDDPAEFDRYLAAANSTAVGNVQAIREALLEHIEWLSKVAQLDLEDIAADGGITAGMVVQQEARNVQLPRLNRLLASGAQSQVSSLQQENERLRAAIEAAPSLLPPAADVDQRYLDGWCDALAYAFANTVATLQDTGGSHE